jgi:hypothetical protein
LGGQPARCVYLGAVRDVRVVINRGRQQSVDLSLWRAGESRKGRKRDLAFRDAFRVIDYIRHYLRRLVVEVCSRGLPTGTIQLSRDTMAIQLQSACHRLHLLAPMCAPSSALTCLVSCTLAGTWLSKGAVVVCTGTIPPLTLLVQHIGQRQHGRWVELWNLE